MYLYSISFKLSTKSYDNTNHVLKTLAITVAANSKFSSTPFLNRIFIQINFSE